VALALMKDLEMVAETSPGEYRLLRTGLGAEELDAMADLYEKRAEADRDRLRRMVLYAQTALCRWKAILDYFGEAVEWDRCGHCDNCEKPIRELAAPPAEKPVRPPNGAAEVLPLATIVGDPAALKPGDAVTLPIFGAGEVRAADAHSVVIELAGGEVREFRR
jgi:ATP-dependent DNA helicase RecQ